MKRSTDPRVTGRPPARALPAARRSCYAVLAVILATLLAYYLCEAVYRLYQLHQIRSAVFQPDIMTEQPIDQFDWRTGFRYVPNVRTRFAKFSRQSGRLRLPETLRTNNLGLLSHRPDHVEKAPGTYRIALLGDSFTAAMEMTRPWPDLLEELLNGQDDLKRRLDVRRFDVLNFGQDGVGLVQMEWIFRHRAARCHPDLVLVNFVADDLLRRPIYRRVIQRRAGPLTYHIALHTYSLPCELENPECFFGTVSMDFEDYEDSDKRQLFTEDIARLRAGRVAWFSLYPELLASRLGWRFGLPPRLFSTVGSAYYASRQEGLARAAEACRQIAQHSRRTLFLFLQENPDVGVPPLVRKLMDQLPELDFTPMGRYLPQDASDREISRWFIPFDGHFTDRGGSVYARAVLARLRQFFLSQSPAP